jgi:hypothetical protein
MRILTGLIVSLLPIAAFADPSPAKSYSHPKSKCVVKASEGEDPGYTVYRGKKIIYQPSSDGITDVSFSPSGKYIAFTNGEINGIDVVKGKFSFSLVILNCESGKVKGYEKSECSKPSDPKVCLSTYSEIKKWSEDEKFLSYEYVSNQKKEDRKIDFSKASLP